MPHKLNKSQHDLGLQAYHAGHGMDDVMEVMIKMRDAEGITEADGASYMAGFATGLIGDIRSIAASPNFTKRGQTA
jgi:hypothetical protein